MTKKILKSILAFSLTFSFLLGGSIIASAENENSNAENENSNTECLLSNEANATLSKALAEAEESKVIKSQNGNKVVEITDPEVLKELEDSIPEQDGKKLVGVSVAYTETKNLSLSKNNSVVTPQLATGYYLKNIHTGEACGVSIIRQSTFKGPSTATLTVKENVSATWSSNTNISASTVSAGLGFSVTSSYEVSDTYQIKVPSGKTYTIVARPYYQTYNFDVWYDPIIGSDYKAGYGNASKPIGVCFYYYE